MRRKKNILLKLTVLAVFLSITAATAMASDGSGEERFYFGDLGQMIAAIIIFILLLVILGRWAWRPLINQLQRREMQIAEKVEKAAIREHEAQDLLKHYKNRLDRADQESQELLAKSHQQAIEQREQLIQQARREANKSVITAKQEIDEAKLEALGELSRQSASMAVDIAAKVLGKALKPQQHQELLEESLEQISKQSIGD